MGSGAVENKVKRYPATQSAAIIQKLLAGDFHIVHIVHIVYSKQLKSRCSKGAAVSCMTRGTLSGKEKRKRNVVVTGAGEKGGGGRHGGEQRHLFLVIAIQEPQLNTICVHACTQWCY